MERQKFEDAFKDAFKEAEADPSEGVWTNIELDLEKEESGKMKRRLLFYKLLAAASVAFAMSVAGIGYYTMTTGQTGLNEAVQLANRSSAGQDSNKYSSQSSSEEQSSAQELAGNSSHTSPDNSHDNGDGVTDRDHSIALNDFPADKSQSNTTTNSGIDRSRASSSNGARAGHSIAGRSASGISDQNLRAAQSDQDMIAYGVDPAAGKRDGTRGGNDSGSHTGDNRITTGGDKTITGRGAASRGANTPSVGKQDNGNTGAFASVAGQGTDDKQKSTEELFGRRPMPAITNSNKAIALAFEKKEEVVADPVALMFARLAEHERALARQGEEEEKSKDNAKKEKLWTSVGFAAGGFNTVNSKVTADPGASLMSSAANNVASEQAKASGVTYSVGVSMGTQLSKRWVLQGGVNYLTQQSDYTATGAVGSADFSSFKAASLNELDKLQTADARQDNKIVPTAPYSVNNNVQFLSVPLQAGYLVINRKLGLQLNAGVSTDLFLQNTINPEGGSLDKTTQGRGADSPYRSVNFSGLVGTELSYKFGSRYRLALNPGLRYPFNSIYKSDLGVEATPLTFDVGLRFRYIFR